MDTQTGTAVTQIRSVAVTVEDQDRALDFYVGTLGFEVRFDTGPGPAGRWIEVAPATGATTIALIAAPEGDHAGIDTGIRLTTADVASDQVALRTAGADVDRELSRWPGVPPMFSFRDPDGNTLYALEG